MRIALSIFLVIALFSESNGQNLPDTLESKNQIILGYGYYDAAHIGYMYKIAEGRYIGTSIGINTTQNSFYFASSLEYLHKFNSLSHRPVTRNVYLDFRLLYWYLNDENYKWNVLSYIGSIGYTYTFNNHFGLKFDIGAGLKTVLSVHRNSFDEIGWPKGFSPNFRIQLYYNL